VPKLAGFLAYPSTDWITQQIVEGRNLVISDSSIATAAMARFDRGRHLRIVASLRTTLRHVEVSPPALRLRKIRISYESERQKRDLQSLSKDLQVSSGMQIGRPAAPVCTVDPLAAVGSEAHQSQKRRHPDMQAYTGGATE
jgi:hypothetical protein